MQAKRVTRERLGSLLRLLPVLVTFAAAVLSGCGARDVTATSANATFSISPGSATIDTNCTGCNATSTRGNAIQLFKATLNRGGAAAVAWSVSGGDPVAGAGAINAAGQYTPPSYLTADRVEVQVTAALKSDPTVRATSVLRLTPGFLQPLTPENMAVGPNGTVTVSGVLAEAGGAAGIRFALSETPAGSSGGEGFLSPPTCQRSARAFTACSVTYTAPPVAQAGSITYVIAFAGGSSSRTEAAILLNSAGVSSNPVAHQQQLAAPMQLGSSGGNNNDLDTRGNTIADCCSGTLGSLVQDDSGRQYLLSNNHVLARSDNASVGDAIVQPGLIDNNCTPNGDGPGTVPVGALTAWMPLRSATTNVDAAIAEVSSRTVDASGSILELGARQPDGSLAAAPLGTSFSAGKGESASLEQRIAKSGRTTGLTCGSVSALSVDVSVDYYRDCAETRPYLTKTFVNQIALTGDRFSDAGDSGATIVDTSNAEPVGLFFAGGIDASGVSQGMANPVADVLNELSAQVGGTTFNFVGGPDHPVSCLSYGDSTEAAAQNQALSDEEIARGQQSLAAARSLVNLSIGILGVAMGKSSDRSGEAAVIVYVDENASPAVPALIDGVRTVVVPTNMRAVSLGAAPLTNSGSDTPQLSASTLNQALAIKLRIAHTLMLRNPAFFGVGVGRSLDNPRDAALVIYVDRRHLPGQLPSTVSGLRTRYVIMDRLHVTRSYLAPFESRRHCLPHSSASDTLTTDPAHLIRPLKSGLF